MVCKTMVLGVKWLKSDSAGYMRRLSFRLPGFPHEYENSIPLSI